MIMYIVNDGINQRLEVQYPRNSTPRSLADREGKAEAIIIIRPDEQSDHLYNQLD